MQTTRFRVDSNGHPIVKFEYDEYLKVATTGRAEMSLIRYVVCIRNERLVTNEMLPNKVSRSCYIAEKIFFVKIQKCYIKPRTKISS